MAEFLSEDFLLYSAAARVLYHEYAAKMPIFDYHCHLAADKIAADHNYDNLTQIWLDGDHYKWRAMRANGIDEEYITGSANDYDKFKKWAQTVPFMLRNPLYYWTHLELKRYFGIAKQLDGGTAREIYESCGAKLKSSDYNVRNLLRKMNVKSLCTTDDPLDSLQSHQKIKDDGFVVRVLPTWRPDRAMAAEDVVSLKAWIGELEEITNIDVKNYQSYLEAIRKRHDWFHANGCRLSDHGLETAQAADYTSSEIEGIFQKILAVESLERQDVLKFKSAMMVDFAVMDFEKGWVQQMHLGALRNNNSRMMRAVGADCGFDSIGDFAQAESLGKFLDRLDEQGKLAKTIIYNLNPADNEVIAAMVGNFQDGSVPGKIQYGSAWWFLDQKDGMERQIDALSNMGLLSRFVGMVTDSRSFLSYPRHEYFRRILCNILGGEVERGELPNDMSLLGAMVEDICFNNARGYFGIEL